MNPKRKKAQEYILDNINKVDPSGKNSERYKKKFDKMDDKTFHQFMLDLKSGEEVLFLYSANAKDHLTIQNLKDQADRLGIKLFERLRLWDSVTKSYYITPKAYCILPLPIRRLSQFVDHKLSVPEGETRIDLLTGQVSQEDRAGSISQVEIQALYARDMKNVITEVLKYRGGDITALAEYRRELEETGRTTIGRDTGSVPRSAVILAQLYAGMHLDLNTVEGI